MSSFFVLVLVLVLVLDYSAYSITRTIVKTATRNPQPALRNPDHSNLTLGSTRATQMSDRILPIINSSEEITRIPMTTG